MKSFLLLSIFLMSFGSCVPMRTPVAPPLSPEALQSIIPEGTAEIDFATAAPNELLICVEYAFPIDLVNKSCMQLGALRSILHHEMEAANY